MRRTCRERGASRGLQWNHFSLERHAARRQWSSPKGFAERGSNVIWQIDPQEQAETHKHTEMLTAKGKMQSRAQWYKFETSLVYIVSSSQLVSHSKTSNRQPSSNIKTQERNKGLQSMVCIWNTVK